MTKVLHLHTLCMGIALSSLNPKACSKGGRLHAGASMTYLTLHGPFRLSPQPRNILSGQSPSILLHPTPDQNSRSQDIHRHHPLPLTRESSLLINRLSLHHPHKRHPRLLLRLRLMPRQQLLRPRLLMKRMPGFNLHSRHILANHPLPIRQHLEHLVRHIAPRLHHLLPVGGQRSPPLHSIQMKHAMSNQQSPHLRIGRVGGVLENVLHVVQIGDADLFGLGRVVVVEHVDTGIAQAGELHGLAEDVEAEVVAHGDLVELGRGEFEDLLAARGGEGGAVEPADEEGEQLGFRGRKVHFFDRFGENRLSSVCCAGGGVLVVVVVVITGGGGGTFNGLGLGVEEALEVGGVV